MKFRIDEQIFQKFPGLLVGVLVVKGINNSSTPAEITAMLREQEARVRSHYNIETLSQESGIDVWRKAYSAFGAKPKDHKSSVENLYRMVLQGVELRHINTLVDLYNIISLKHMVPVGGEDIDATQGDVQLTFASDHEASALLLGDKEQRAPHAGEVIYKDDVSTICRRWNWREADRTKLTESTKNAILVIEALPPVSKEVVMNALKELNDLIEKFCGGKVEECILDEQQLKIEV